jgi:hypothetical protein
MPVTYDSIATISLSSASSTIDFTSISQSFTDLRVVMSNAFMTTTASQMNFHFNGDTSSNYAIQQGSFTSSSYDGRADANQPSFYFRGNDVQTLANGWPTASYIDILNYSNTGRYKTAQWNHVYPRTGTGGWSNAVGLWQSNAAINRITFTVGGQTFTAGTVFSIYGILRA